jgi:hypothetical protein
MLFRLRVSPATRGFRPANFLRPRNQPLPRYQFQKAPPSASKLCPNSRGSSLEKKHLLFNTGLGIVNLGVSLSLVYIVWTIKQLVDEQLKTIRALMTVKDQVAYTIEEGKAAKEIWSKLNTASKDQEGKADTERKGGDAQLLGREKPRNTKLHTEFTSGRKGQSDDVPQSKRENLWRRLDLEPEPIKLPKKQPSQRPVVFYPCIREIHGFPVQFMDTTLKLSNSHRIRNRYN